RIPQMRCAWRLIILALVLGGCAPANQERINDYNQDGLFLFQRGDYRSARESFEAALALRPNDPGLLYNVGQCYDQMGNAAKAECYYLECMRLDPNNGPCRHAYSAMLFRLGRRDDARRMIEEWQAKEPGLATPYAEYAWLQVQLGDLPRAQALLQQALEVDPRDQRALIELGQVYEALQRPDRAMVVYERALELNPRQPAIVARLNEIQRMGVQHPKPE